MLIISMLEILQQYKMDRNNRLLLFVFDVNNEKSDYAQKSYLDKQYLIMYDGKSWYWQ